MSNTLIHISEKEVHNVSTGITYRYNGERGYVDGKKVIPSVDMCIMGKSVKLVEDEPATEFFSLLLRSAIKLESMNDE